MCLKGQLCHEGEAEAYGREILRQDWKGMAKPRPRLGQEIVSLVFPFVVMAWEQNPMDSAPKYKCKEEV